MNAKPNKAKAKAKAPKPQKAQKQTSPRKPLAPGTLVLRNGVAELLGISRQRVGVIQEQLPRPVDTPDDRPIWRRRDIERWKQTRERRDGAKKG